MQQDRNGGKKKIVLTMENFEQNLKIVVSNSISRDFDFQYIEKKDHQ